MKRKVLALCLAVVMLIGVVAVFAACNNSNLTTVRMAIHKNEGASLIAYGEEQGIFEKWGIKLQITQVENGVAEMTAMRADNRTLDVGYIGAGVAWNCIDGNGNGLQWIFFDSLGNAENLMARDGKFVDTNANGTYDKDEIFEGLKGETIYFQTGATPGGYFKALLTWLNEGKEAAEQLWMTSETTDYLAGYTAPNSNEELKVTVVNMENDKIAAGMSTSSSSRVDIAVAYSPVPKTIYEANKDIKKICDWSVLEGQGSVSTYVASEKWLQENPETAQNLVKAMYETAILRAKSDENKQAAITAAEKLCGVSAGSYNKDLSIQWTQAQYEEGFATKDAAGYGYMQYLYDSSVGNVTAGNKIKTFEQAFNDSYLLNAIEHFKK